MPSFTKQLILSHPQDTVVISAANAELRGLIRQMNGHPSPVI